MDCAQNIPNHRRITLSHIWNSPELDIKPQLSCFGYIKRHQTLDKLILERNMKGIRNRGRPLRYWENDVEDRMEARVWRVGRTTEDQ